MLVVVRHRRRVHGHPADPGVYSVAEHCAETKTRATVRPISRASGKALKCFC